MYGQPLSWWQRFCQRFQPTPIEMAGAELKDAELAVLQSQSSAEYAGLREQIHTLEAKYHQDRVARLKVFVLKHTDPDDIQPSLRVQMVPIVERSHG